MTLESENVRITDLEIKLAHSERTLEELNEVVASHSKSIEVLERRVQMLMQRAAEAEADGASGEVSADQRPPHW